MLPASAHSSSAIQRISASNDIRCAETTFKSREAAQRHERAVQFFKRDAQHALSVLEVALEAIRRRLEETAPSREPPGAGVP